ncbi:hypothetical protein CQA61_30050, partial [Klebsiella pneumoniae]
MHRQAETALRRHASERQRAEAVFQNEYIAVDWAPPSWRAWRMRDGECIDKLKLPCGVTRLNGSAPKRYF